MNKWTNKEIVAFDKAQTLQNRPYNNDKTTFEEDNLVWEVTVDNQVFIRGAKGVNDTKWYQAGTQNGQLYQLVFEFVASSYYFHFAACNK